MHVFLLFTSVNIMFVVSVGCADGSQQTVMLTIPAGTPLDVS